MNLQINKVAVLFSAGSDSSLAAAMAAECFREVHLLTYKRLGIFKLGNIVSKVELLGKRYPDAVFNSQVLSIEEFFKDVSYEHYLSNLLKFGLRLVSVCGLCRLAMHWRTIIYCLEYNIKNVYDGASNRSRVFPEQNMEVMVKNISLLYADFGIAYSAPVYYTKDAELELYNRGIIPVKRIRLTERDLQPVCIDNFLFSRFVYYYLGSHSWEKYVQGLAQFYAYKIDYVRKKIKASNP